MALKANGSGGRSAAAFHISTVIMNVSTTRIETVFILFMTYFLTQSSKSINTFQKNKMFHHTGTNLEGN